VANQGNLGSHPETLDFGHSELHHLRQLFCARVIVDVGVANKYGSPRKHQDVERIQAADIRCRSDHLGNKVSMDLRTPHRAADQAIGVPQANGERADQSCSPLNFTLGVLR
jgi:hypothetical protein